MARHKQIQAAEVDEPKVDISSLIDVCFLLLIYFLITTTLERKENDLQLALPNSSAQSSSPPKVQPLFLRIGGDGAIYSGQGASEETLDTDVNQRDVPILVQKIEAYNLVRQGSGPDNEAVVQLYVEPEAKQQRVVDVLNALSGADITTVTFTDLTGDEE